MRVIALNCRRHDLYTRLKIMERPEPDGPLPPFFEFSSAEEGDVFVFDKPGHLNQEPPELEEYGPDEVFDSRGSLAELGVEDFVVVLKGWSEQPDVGRFDSHLRAAAARYLPAEEVSALGTFELSDRLAVVVSQWQREHMLFARLSMSARNMWRSVWRRSG